MPLKSYNDLNTDHLDALREIGNIGSGNAATALASMLDKEVDIAVPEVRFLEVNDVVERLGGPEQIYIGLLLSLSEDVSGMIMFLLNKNFANNMLETFTGEGFAEDGSLSELNISAIQEVGNIMAASYVNAIASLTGLTINISVPSISIDMVGSILTVPAIYYANISDKIMLIENQLGYEKNSDSFNPVLLIPEVESLEKIMISLGLE